MVFNYQCSECGAKLKIRESLIGSEVHCPKCQVVFRVADPRYQEEVYELETFEAPPVVIENNESNFSYSKKRKSKLLPIAFAACAILIIIGLAILVSKQAVDSASPDNAIASETSEPELETPATSYIVFDWPENDRPGSSVLLDGTKTSVPSTGDVEFEVQPGPHKIVIIRSGFSPIETTLVTESGQRHEYCPQWSENLPLADLPSLEENDASSGKEADSHSYEDWLQDLELAKQVATIGNKNILLLFSGSDWNPACKRLASEVFFQSAFRDYVSDKYVLVQIDSPRNEAVDRVEDSSRNSEMIQKYAIEGFPTAILADSQGRPYGVIRGYQSGGVDFYTEQIEQFSQTRSQLAGLLNMIESFDDIQKKQATFEMLCSFLESQNLTPYYESDIAKWKSSIDPVFDPPSQPISISDVDPSPGLPVTDSTVSSIEQNLDEILEMHETGMLFVKKEYPTLRDIFVRNFEQTNAAEIKEAYGEDYELMNQWLDDHEDIKGELYMAIDSDYDDVSGALSLFKALKDQFPEIIETYGELAVATAVTWDQTRKGVYDYKFHQYRTKSVMPAGTLEAIDNFKYLVDAKQYMQGRIRFMPWEFLVLVVNHRTPLAERQWALQNYLNKRSMFGKCYHDVPYDHVMLESQSQNARLNGKPYNLANIRTFGGVCAMQADFACRVGKSIGVPAAYVSGESRGGERHAWVMWVELKQVTPTSISFSLESYGRYRGDKYYVGNLKDPKTGLEITDRQLELQLQNVGISPHSKRHADLLMKAYPLLKEKLEMNVKDSLLFLNKVITMSPGNTDAWRAIAAMSRDGSITTAHNTTMRAALRKLFTTFAAFPDFTWEIFDDLIAYNDSPKERANLYNQLLMLYIKAQRPDLACKAQLKYADYLVADGQHSEAIIRLAATIKNFPDEGRYVPVMFDKLEEICRTSGIEGVNQQLVQFYQEYLPMIPPKRGNRLSPFFVAMNERAVERLKELGRPDLAQIVANNLARIKSGFH